MIQVKLLLPVVLILILLVIFFLLWDLEIIKFRKFRKDYVNQNQNIGDKNGK